MDLLVKGLLKNFRASEELEFLSDSDAFEVFTAWLALPSNVVGQIRSTDLLLDSGTPGIDSIVLEINGEVVWDKGDVDGACSKGGALEVVLHFVQTKHSEKIDSAQILNFGAEVCDVLRAVAKGYSKRDAIAAALDHLYDQYSSSLRKKPEVRMYFATGAPERSVNDTTVQQRFTKVTQDVRDLTHVGSVEGSIIGANEIHELWTRRQNGNVGSLQFGKVVNLPAMPGVDQALLGYASVADLLDLLTTDDDQLDESLFYDNVRGFQGSGNNVNQQIVETLESPSRALLPVMNNGITIVAENYVQKPGDAVGLSGYQVVNGGQTSHCLFAARDGLDGSASETYVPVRIVVTQDSDVATSIVKATNSQTPIREGELESLTKFQKRLEEFYDADVMSVGLRYERRAGQFFGEDVIWTRVVNIRDQMKAIGAVFLNRPHESAGYVGQLRDLIGTLIFADSHDLAPYTASAFAAYKLENAFRYDFPNSYKPIRYHVLMIAKFFVLEGDSSSLDGKVSRTQAEKLVSKFQAGDISVLLQNAADLIVEVNGGSVPTAETAKTYAFTQELLRRIRN